MAKKKEVAERWAAIPGFFGLYEVSTLGRARSLPRSTACGVLGGRFLKPSSASNGYLRITLSSGGVNHRMSLHRAVLLSFVGECPAGSECRHLDGARANCALDNLAWGTRSENARDRIRHGTHVDNRGERHGMARLSNEDAAEIRRFRRAGRLLAEIASKFHTSQATVSRICTGRGWIHVYEDAV